MSPKIFWIAFLVACLPMLAQHLRGMWKQEAYHYLPALFLLILMLMYQRWDRRLKLPTGWIAWISILLSLFLLSVSVLLFSPWVAALACMIAATVFFTQHEDGEAGGSLAYFWPLGLLWLTLPLSLDRAMISSLQHRSSELSSFVLDIINIPHSLQGNIIELPSGRLFVEEACSGVQSLFTIIFLSFAIVVFNRRRVWTLPCYLLAAVFWAGLMNVARLVTIAYVKNQFGWDWAHGLAHQLIGYFFLVLAGLFLLSTDRLIRVLFFATTSERSGSASNPIASLWNGMFEDREVLIEEQGSKEGGRTFPLAAWICSGICVLLFCSSTFQIGNRLLTSRPDEVKRVAFLSYPAVIELPNFQLIEHETKSGESVDLPYGQNADLWRGRIGNMNTIFAVNQPYPLWHDLNQCYTGVGWTLNQTENVTTEDGVVYTRSSFVRDNQHAYLWFMAFDGERENVRPATASLQDRFKFFVVGRNTRLASVGGQNIAIAQLFVESTGPILLPYESDLQTAFDEFRKFVVSTGETPAAENSAVENSAASPTE